MQGVKLHYSNRTWLRFTFEVHIPKFLYPTQIISDDSAVVNKFARLQS